MKGAVHWALGVFFLRPEERKANVQRPRNRGFRLAEYFLRFLIGLLFVRAPAMAEDAPLRVLALDGGPGDGVRAVVERLLGEDAEIRIVFLRAPGDAGDPKLGADVMLSGDTLAAPMGAGFVFKPDAAATHPALIEGSLTLPRPDTEKSITQIVTLHRVGADAAKAKVVSFTLRWVSVEACKTALTQAVADDATGRGRRLEVSGSLPGLREQLREWKVPFEDNGKDLPPRFSSENVVIADEVPDDAKLPALGDGASLFRIHNRPGSGVEVLRKEGRVRLTEVWLQGVPDWKRSPLLLRLLTEHLKPPTPASAP